MTDKEFLSLIERLVRCGAKHHLDFRMLKKPLQEEFWEKLKQLIKEGGVHGNDVKQ